MSFSQQQFIELIQNLEIQDQFDACLNKIMECGSEKRNEINEFQEKLEKKEQQLYQQKFEIQELKEINSKLQKIIKEQNKKIKQLESVVDEVSLKKIQKESQQNKKQQENFYLKQIQGLDQLQNQIKNIKVKYIEHLKSAKISSLIELKKMRQNIQQYEALDINIVLTYIHDIFGRNFLESDRKLLVELKEQFIENEYSLFS
ncbi:hypothetical protein PPERSA_10186 [Pseudocohnilembus persalinus]|uniref:Uncharacterized protein n=1 Tax=Pseudocohnilembus persalinus TaxID=266149 RepID=A0A0V0QM15_PSEPJ|nr:hypothetical protein PPERSA_10186 [Pseudocohnilembus persalinus]|eukprot:KRX03105.1 hypothetical protein PPERSA_10186 [Pseudocohnilembus persalinus]